MSENRKSSVRSSSVDSPASGLRRRHVPTQAEPLPMPPPRPTPSRWNQHLAEEHKHAARVETASRALAFVGPRAMGAAVPVVGAARSVNSFVTSSSATVQHAQRGEVRQASASALSAASSLASVAHVPVVPQVLTAASAVVSAPETIRQHQGSVAPLIASARASSYVPTGLSNWLNGTFKTITGRQE